MGSSYEVNLLRSTIRDKCGEELVDNLEETIVAQNPELGLVSGDTAARFKFGTKRGQVKMVIGVGSEKRKNLLNKKT